MFQGFPKEAVAGHDKEQILSVSLISGWLFLEKGRVLGMIKMLLWLIRLYQKYISPALGNRCRFIPTCSQYAYEAILRHGTLKGTGLAVWRVLRCNPFGKAGYDPVPPKRERRRRNSDIKSRRSDRIKDFDLNGKP